MFEEFLRQAALTTTTAADLLRRLRESPFLFGTSVTAEIPIGSTSVTVRHGLGRSMNGAFVVGATDASRTVSVDISADSEFVTVRISSTSLAVFTVKLRVF